MIRWLEQEAFWLAVGILAVGLALVVVALANDAPTSLDVFAGFVAVVGGIALYVLARDRPARGLGGSSLALGAATTPVSE